MPKATVIISADNQLKKGIDPAKKAMLELQGIASKLDRQISKGLSIAGIAATAVASWKLITSAAKECINAYSEAEKVSKRLEAVWANVGAQTGKTAKDVDDLAESLEKETYFSSESIKQAELLLAATESLTEEGFDRALNASLDLAAALGEDVTSAAQTLAKAIQEPESALSRLKTIGVSFTDEEKDQIKALAEANDEYAAQDIILTKIEQKYKDVAKAINNTPTGTIDNIKDTLGDIKEALGGALLDSISPALETLYGWLQKISAWVADVADLNGVANALKQGESLASFPSALLERAMREYGNAKNSNNPEFRNRTVYDQWIDAIEKELATRATNNVISPTVTGGGNSNSTTTQATAILSDFFSSYMPKDLVAEYTAVIDTAQDYLDKLAQNVPATKAELRELLGLSEGTSGAQIKEEIENGGYIPALEKIIATYTEKLDALTTGILDSPTLTDLDSILASYGKQSNAYQIKQLKEEYNRIAEAYEYASEEDKVYLREILASNEKQRKELEGGIDEIVNGSFLDNLENALSGAFQNLGFDSDSSSTAAGTVISTFTQNLGETGEVIERLASNMAMMGPALGAIVTALQYVVEGIAETIGPVLNDFVMNGIEPLRELGRVIGEILLPILESIMPLVEESGRMLMGIFNALGVIITPIAEFIGAILTPIIAKITATLEILEPLLKVIAGAVITVSTAFEWVAQWIKHIFAVLFNALASIEIMGWRPLEGLGMSDPGKPGSYQDMWQANWEKVNKGFEYSPTELAESASMNQALSQASYRGATNVTINIYATGPFVGDNGMRDFARMIREEFDALDYYGVSA